MPKYVGYGTKYPAEGAPVRKHGGNAPIHDGIVSNEDISKPGPKMSGLAHAPEMTHASKPHERARHT